jgi:hypothetical protein
VLLQPRHVLGHLLRERPEWRVEREDTRSVTFVRVEPAPGCEAYPIPSL